MRYLCSPAKLKFLSERRSRALGKCMRCPTFTWQPIEALHVQYGRPMTEMKTAKTSSKTEAALASIEARELKASAAGYVMIGGAMAYGEGALGDGIFGKLSSAAKWFVLWFAIIVPVYLFWSVAL